MNFYHAGFTGTRNGITFHQAQKIRVMLTALDKVMFFHHGDCVGADASAHHIAIQCGKSIIIHPPVDDKYRAFMGGGEVRYAKEYIARNHDIVDECMVLIACPGERIEKMRSGTWATIRYARKMKKQIIIIFPDGETKIENA